MVDLSSAQQQFMENRYFASFAILSPTTGLPHVTTVWVHYEAGKFYVISNKATAKYRFLKAGQNKIGINVIDPSGFPYLSVNGYAQVIYEHEMEGFWELILRIITKYNEGVAIDQWLDKMKSAPDNARRFLIELDPENVFTHI